MIHFNFFYIGVYCRVKNTLQRKFPENVLNVKAMVHKMKTSKLEIVSRVLFICESISPNSRIVT